MNEFVKIKDSTAGVDGIRMTAAKNMTTQQMNACSIALQER